MDKFTLLLNSTPVEFNYFIYQDPRLTEEYFVLIYGQVEGKKRIPLRIQGSCFLGETFGGVKCDCKCQLDYSLRQIVNAGAGILIYLRFPLFGHSFTCYREDTPDFRYDGIVEILHRLKVESVILYTENQKKIVAVGKYVDEVRYLPGVITQYNAQYLREKSKIREENRELDRSGDKNK